jgi:UDP-2,3-diacylglucosamine pyrophosphatase LpxH
MSVSLPLYEDLYVVSDLHLGGTQGIRIFKQGDKLAALIRQLAATSPNHGGQRALVLNGDIIDTLAEGLTHYVASPAQAEVLVSRIMSFKDFSPVWSALGEFVSKEKHRLVICVGNHDIELAYPNVHELIVEKLGGSDNETVRGRILFSTTGVGHLCRVGKAGGSARVLCFHGNEYDDWNAVSPESMNRLVRSSVLGVASKIADDPPNAGTQLVIDVMNAIKKEYPFVDLLKPEIETVFNVLLAIKPSTIKALPGVMKLATKAEVEGGKRVNRVLGGADDTAASSSVSSWRPKGRFGEFIQQEDDGSDLLASAWEASASDTLAAPTQTDEILGLGDFIGNSFKYLINRITKNRSEALRLALLDWVGSDKTWLLDGPDDVCDALAEHEPDVDVAIAGHTHLRRQKRVSGYLYLNTGTWARLMRLDKEILNDSTRFADLWATLEKKSMEAIDGLDGIVLNQGTVGVVRLSGNGTSVEGALCETTDDDSTPRPVDKASWQKVGPHA